MKADEKAKLIKKIEQLQHELTVVKTVVRKKDDQITDLKKASSKLENFGSSKELIDRNSELTEQVNILKKKLNTEVSRSESAILEKELSEKDKKELQEKNFELQQEIEKYINESSNYSQKAEEHDKLEKEKKELESKNKLLADYIRKQKEEMAIKDKEEKELNDKLNNIIIENENKLKENQKLIEEEVNKRKVLEENLKAQQEEIVKKLKSDFEKWKEDFNNEKQKIINEKNDMEQKQKLFENSIKEKQRELNEANSKIKQITQDKENLLKENNKLKKFNPKNISDIIKNNEPELKNVNTNATKKPDNEPIKNQIKPSTQNTVNGNNELATMSKMTNEQFDELLKKSPANFKTLTELISHLLLQLDQNQKMYPFNQLLEKIAKNVEKIYDIQTYLEHNLKYTPDETNNALINLFTDIKYNLILNSFNSTYFDYIVNSSILIDNQNEFSEIIETSKKISTLSSCGLNQQILFLYEQQKDSILKSCGLYYDIIKNYIIKKKDELQKIDPKVVLNNFIIEKNENGYNDDEINTLKVTYKNIRLDNKDYVNINNNMVIINDIINSYDSINMNNDNLMNNLNKDLNNEGNINTEITVITTDDYNKESWNKAKENKGEEIVNKIKNIKNLFSFRKSSSKSIIDIEKKSDKPIEKSQSGRDSSSNNKDSINTGSSNEETDINQINQESQNEISTQKLDYYIYPSQKFNLKESLYYHQVRRLFPSQKAIILEIDSFFSPYEIKSLLNALCLYCENLVSISIIYNTITSISSNSDNKNYQVLNEYIPLILKTLKTIEKLTIKNIPFSNENINKIISSLKNTKIKSLSINNSFNNDNDTLPYFVNYFMNNLNLEILDLSNNKINIPSMILPVLNFNSNLKKLIFSNIILTEIDMECICDFINNNKKIQILDISNNPLTLNMCKSLGRVICNFENKLRGLIVDNCELNTKEKILCLFNKENLLIRKCSLNNNMFKNEGILSLIEFCVNNPNIKEISMKGCGIDCDGIKEFFNRITEGIAFDIEYHFEDNEIKSDLSEYFKEKDSIFKNKNYKIYFSEEMIKKKFVYKYKELEYIHIVKYNNDVEDIGKVENNNN